MFSDQLRKVVSDIKKESANASEVWNMASLQKEANKCYDEVVKNFDMYEFETNRAEYLVETIAPSSAGIHQPEYVIDLLGLSSDDPEVEEYYNSDDESYDPEIWDDVIYPEMDKLTQELNSKIKIKNKPGYESSIYIANFGDSGDYGIILIVEKD
jgi:hypothetical protein